MGSASLLATLRSMAVDEALRAILGEWTAIEPLLTVKELTALARISRRTHNSVEDQLTAVFQLIAPTLPADHAAWTAMRSPGSTSPASSSTSAAVVLEVVRLASSALASPSRAADAAADALVEQSNEALVREGAVPASRSLGGRQLLSVRAGERVLYPLFQFESVRPYRQHKLVATLSELLSADIDPAGAAAWWLTPNPWLDARPADLIGTERESEIRYAADQLANDSW